MITIKEFPDKRFTNKEDMFKALRENKDALIAQKKMITKFADTVEHTPKALNNKGEAIKADTVDISTIKSLDMDLAINTTKLMDSHSDVHFDGLWNKSLKEKKSLYLLQEHKMQFSNIIIDDVKASAKEMTWKELGADYPGSTQVLLFNVNVSKERNPFMFEQYAKGYVKNHSVGMRYVKLDLAMNSDSKYDEEEKAIWDKYINDIVNKEQAEAQGYFWAVHEAKVIEGSAVPIGSNTITPTINTESKELEPGNHSKGEPSNDTRFNVADALQKISINL